MHSSFLRHACRGHRQCRFYQHGGLISSNSDCMSWSILNIFNLKGVHFNPCLPHMAGTWFWWEKDRPSAHQPPPCQDLERRKGIPVLVVWHYRKCCKSVFAHGQVGRISGADLISLLDTGKLLAVDTRPVEDWKMGSLSHRFSVIFDVGILQSSCCYLLCWCYIYCLGVIFNVRVRLPTQCFHSRLFCLHSHWRASCWRKRSGGGEKER